MTTNRNWHGRALAGAVVFASAMALGGCTYLYPGASFERDVEWNKKWTEQDNATKEIPQTMDGNLRPDDSWDELFPGSER